MSEFNNVTLGLGSYNRCPQDKLQRYLANLSHSDQKVREEATKNLYMLFCEVPKTPDMIEKLIKALGDKSVIVVVNVRMILKNMGKVAVPALARALSHPNENIREEAATALERMGPLAISAIASLIMALGDSSWSVRLYVGLALSSMGKVAVPALTKALSHSNKNIREAAATALGRMGSLATSAVPLLKNLAANDKDPNVRFYARIALKKILSPKPALNKSIVTKQIGRRHRLNNRCPQDKLQQYLNNLSHQNKKIREQASKNLYLSFCKSPYMLGKLIMALGDSSWRVRLYVDLILKNMGKTAVPALTKALLNPKKNVRKQAAKVLGRMGPLAKSAVPLLKKLAAKDPSYTVRLSARRALIKIKKANIKKLPNKSR